MWQQIRYFCWFWYTLIRKAVYIVVQRKQETKRAYAMIAAMEARFKGQFNPATKRKIAVSHGIYNPMICDTFCALQQRTTSIKERERYIQYFTCSSLFDDFTDYHTITTEQLKAISFDAENYHATSFDERVFQYCHLALKQFVANKASYIKVTERLYEAQLFSQHQYNSQLDDDTIEAITFAKGGNSVLLCSYYLDTPVTDAEAQCWYTIGTIIQLTNDLYDIWKDLQDNIATLPNRMTNAYAFEGYFLQRIEAMKKAIAALPYGKKQKQHFSLAMAGIYSFGLIAIEQLKHIQGDALQLPALNSLPRKALIVDMEKIHNLKQWFKHVYKHAYSA
ncbi:MAG TPA: hypothetical protein DCL43_11870 [Chitinophagaceae bacterium]|nr:hypothetical protein [Chitinophagaceae bacterium]HAN38346.1 hypothetical protein [Chitinophagaceae bacterium]